MCVYNTYIYIYTYVYIYIYIYTYGRIEYCAVPASAPPPR